MKKVWLWVLLGAVLQAEFGFCQTTLESPRLGMVFEEVSRSIRPIVGYPGAAILGEPVFRNVDSAIVSPDARWAIAVEGETTSLLGLNSQTRMLLSSFDQAVWASDSSAFALSTQGGMLLSWYSLEASGEWTRKRELNLGGYIGRLLAVDAVRGELWLRRSQEEHMSQLCLYRLDSEGVEIIQGIVDPVAISLPAKSGEPWYAAGKTQGSLWRIKTQENGWLAEELVLSDLPAGQVIFVHALKDSSLLAVFLDNESNGRLRTSKLFRLDSNAAIQQAIDLEAIPDGIIAIPGTKFLRLQNQVKSASTILIYDPEAREVYFVPATPVSVDQGDLQ